MKTLSTLAGALLLSFLPITPEAAELAPLADLGSGQGLFSPRTVTAAFEIDRDQARLVAYTLKPRPFAAPVEAEAALAHAGAESLQVEVVLHGEGGARFTRRVDVGALCLEHGPDAPAHVEGDVVRLHRDTFTVELPEVAGLDTVEIAYHDGTDASPLRTAVGSARLDAAHFTAAGEPVRYAELAFASADEAAGAEAGAATPETAGTVHWPEEYGDAERYRVWGDASEATRRINVVIVPDGYARADKAAMERHAEELVTKLRSKSPYKEHDRFFNYTLVYAYSNQSGTDQCDCGTVRDTAMNTRFPDLGYGCGDAGNRCLYYGTLNGGASCDENTTAENIAAAELRAPAKDVTLVMVNTSREGGCGGTRAVYSAAEPTGVEAAVHELGHSLAALHDEYDGQATCGAASGHNVSTNATTGSWPEWIAEIGAPRQGAKGYDSCVFRPEANCNMRELGQPFCRVCSQRWALAIFNHARVRPTAPIASASPAAAVAAAVGVPVAFAVEARLASGASVTNRVTWQVAGPDGGLPATVATGTLAHTLSFSAPGTYTVTCEVAADTNFVKPEKFAANVDVATWTVTVSGSGSCTPPASVPALGNVLRLARAGGSVELTWTDSPDASGYEVAFSADPAFTAPSTLGTAPSGGAGVVDAGALPGPGLRVYRVRQEQCGVTSAY